VQDKLRHCRCLACINATCSMSTVNVLGRYQKSGAPHKMQKFYTSTTIERDSESEGSDSRPPEMLL